MKRKICVITGTRAEYGLLYWVIKGIHDDPELKLLLTITGMHLSPEFGLTVKEIENDNFPISDKVEMLLSSDSETAIAISMGLGMIGFSKVYERNRPDIIVVLGDRFEILSAVAASIPFRIPVAHIHGGEATEGLIDEPIRHAITKMSHIHFAATDKYMQRIIQMGEAPENVFCFGAPGLDNIKKLNLLSRTQLLKEIDIAKNKNIGIVTCHPITLERDTAELQISEVLNAIRKFEMIFWVFTLPNADTEGRIIIRKLNDFIARYPDKGRVFTSLGQLRYLSLLKNASIMVGNSSSGLIEAPSFELPVVNIGDRQRGRIRGQNIIDVAECREEDIVAAIEKALSFEFKELLKGMKNPYGEGNASEKIIDKLKSISLGEDLVKKRFHDNLQ